VPSSRSVGACGGSAGPVSRAERDLIGACTKDPLQCCPPTRLTITLAPNGRHEEERDSAKHDTDDCGSNGRNRHPRRSPCGRRLRPTGPSAGPPGDPHHTGGVSPGTGVGPRTGVCGRLRSGEDWLVRGKSDPIDAEAAARPVLAGEVHGVAKADTETVGMVRALRVVRRSALKARTQASNQVQGILVCAPAPLREEFRKLSMEKLVQRAAAFRPGLATTATAANKLALRSLATRYQALTDEIEFLDLELRRLTMSTAPALCRLKGVGPDVAGALVVAAGDNRERLRSEASFASLCGASPIPASSGKTNRYRLNRGGDRIANNALWRIVMVRLASDQETRNYMVRRTLEGRSKREIIRCLKRYVAREVYRTFLAPAVLAVGA